MNRTRPVRAGVLAAGFLLAGCGTVTAVPKAVAPITWKDFTIEAGPTWVQARIPISWLTDMGSSGVGDTVFMTGSHNDESHQPTSAMGLTLGNPDHWYPSKPLTTQVSKNQVTIYKRLNAVHNYVWVTVPNNTKSRQIAQDVIRSVKQIPVPDHKT